MRKNPAKTNYWFFGVGVLLILFSSVTIGILNIGIFYLLGVPILPLILGIVFIWISNVKVKIKIFLTIIPIPMVLFVFFANYQFNKAQPETFLIPNDFRGEIVVFYDENCGQPDVEENGRRIYQISKYGVLITRFTENNGFLDRKFYLVDGDGNKTEIPEFQRQNFETEKKEWRLFQRSQVEGFTKETVGAFWAYGADTYRLSRNSLGYIVSDYHYFERDEKERSFDRKEFTRKADQLLKECRRSE